MLIPGRDRLIVVKWQTW